MRRAALVLGLFASACDPAIVVGHAQSIALVAVDAEGPAPVADAAIDVPFVVDAAADARDAPASIPWFASHETGTLDEWLTGAGWQNVAFGGSLAVVTTQAHGGTHALAATIPTDGVNESQAMVGRDVTALEATYGAYYFFPVRPQTNFWVIMKFANLAAGRVELFDIDVGSDTAGDPRLFLYDFGSGKSGNSASVVLPVGQWVHIEAKFRSTPNADGRLSVAQDGVTILDTGARATATDEHVSWSVGSASKWVVPTPVTIYIDDAEIR